MYKSLSQRDRPFRAGLDALSAGEAVCSRNDECLTMAVHGRLEILKRPKFPALRSGGLANFEYRDRAYHLASRFTLATRKINARIETG